MKKVLKIGILAGVLATVPVVGAFAAGTYTFVDDQLVTTLNLTVSDACAFSRTSTSTSVTMNPNALSTSMTSTYKIICNDAAGYSVGAAFTALTGPGTDITYSATTPSKGSGTWTATLGTASGTTNIAATGGVLMSSDGPTTAAGTSQQVTYKVGTAAAQAAGSYTGTATYTATQNS